jgi:predicted GNAT superfamily acetyltransferase
MTDPWALAHAAAETAGVSLRPATSLADAEAIVEVMIATWGPHQLLPSEMIVALGESGNEPYGAFDGDEMIGYVLGWAGMDPHDGLHVHSHMLAARPQRRHRGVGRALKLAQRAQALEQGIELVRWTFDPTIARNAWFNMGKLGATADRFRRNFYGVMHDDQNRGERSDRLVVRWDLVREPIPHEVPGPLADLVTAVGEADPEPSVSPVDLGGVRGVRIAVPPDHQGMRERAPDLARAWRDVLADAFEELFADGWVVATFDRDASAYVLTPREALA